VSPITHLLGSWLAAAGLTDNPRDRRLVTMAGVLPDLDGLGLLLDLPNRLLGRPETFYYAQYHHFLLHGVFGALALAGLAALLARHRGRVALAALAVVHLHLLCDLAGSRGPSPSDLWPIYYGAPFTGDPMWVWQGQWRLDGWLNRVISVLLLGWAMAIAVRRGDSFVGVFSRRADAVFVGVLRKWHQSLRPKRPGGPGLPRTR
jgi:inner membrane protein